MAAGGDGVTVGLLIGGSGWLAVGGWSAGVGVLTGVCTEGDLQPASMAASSTVMANARLWFAIYVIYLKGVLDMLSC